MDRTELKASLQQYTKLAAERKQIEYQIKIVELQMASLQSPNLDGMPHGENVSNTVAAAVEKHIEIIDKYHAELFTIAEKQAEVEILISALPSDLRRLMRYRYINGLTWENVCVSIGYSWRQTHRLHAIALDKILGIQKQFEKTGYKGDYTMSYNVSFKAKLDGVEQWVHVGDWINHTGNTAAMIKEVCGSCPSNWNGKSCEELIPVLDAGVTELMRYSQRYSQFEPSNGWGTVESTIEFLSDILENCKTYPTAVIEID